MKLTGDLPSNASYSLTLCVVEDLWGCSPGDSVDLILDGVVYHDCIATRTVVRVKGEWAMDGGIPMRVLADLPSSIVEELRGDLPGRLREAIANMPVENTCPLSSCDVVLYDEKDTTSPFLSALPSVL